MRFPLLTPVLLTAATGVYAQKPQGAKPRMLYELYTGSIPHDGKMQYTQLILQHECRYCDEGTYVFKQGKSELKGEWTVLRGSAVDPNATVVELISKAQNLYFLRRKDHHLQQLDTALKALKPASKYLLRKQ